MAIRRRNAGRTQPSGCVWMSVDAGAPVSASSTVCQFPAGGGRICPNLSGSSNLWPSGVLPRKRRSALHTKRQKAQHNCGGKDTRQGQTRREREARSVSMRSSCMGVRPSSGLSPWLPWRETGGR